MQELIREYTAWAFTLETGSEQAPTFQGLEQELASLPGIYAPPGGRLLLATHEARAAGCVALKPRDATTGEIKRLYVRPGFRGWNIGALLVAALLAEARVCGYGRVVLDSHVSMARAHALYEAAGFRRTSAPSGFPDELKPVVVFMEITLA